MLTLTVVILLCVALYLYGTRTFKYWEKRGIKHDKPVPFFGNNSRMYLWKKSMTQIGMEMYWKYPKEKVVGFYRAMRPELVIRDPEIIKLFLLFLVSDFGYFHFRGINTHKTVVEPIAKNLFLAEGDLWKLLRQRMTPAFTSGKLKAMFPLIVERAERLQTLAINAPKTGRVLDSREIMARYTTDFIGACGFGLDMDSLSVENSSFRQLGIDIFKVEIGQIVKQMLKEMFPETFKHVKIFGKLENDAYALVRNILQKRNYEPCGRNDFVDLLLECKKKGKIVGQSIELIKSNGMPEEVSLELTEEIMMAQIMVFFAAGFETSSSSTSYTLHELAYNPEEQRKVQEEVDRVLKKYDNKLSYDAVSEMTYLHCAFKEGIRMFPSLGHLVRKCARKYTFPDLDLTIDEGVTVLIPVQALHKDPLYFDEPERFKPSRFLTDFINPMTKNIYLPFGEGPRACIGERLGLMQSLSGLAAVLSRYSVEPAPETVRHLKVDPSSNMVQGVIGGLPLIFKSRS
ncbi:PREDICTED: cytochrome P450 6B6-like [Papilio polytes]|uniref:cytochrome P450 6B6-like n=1 Tax=Papilio polytes TaxID=76194 RepID=UPI0006767686|nr:PREDICTED: cytochrome P450 6B6-like [Papilio polytes]